MKIKMFFILIAFLTVSALAQDSAIEKTFEKNKRSFSVTRFAMGEDASSGYDYVVYKKKLQVQKIRVIWSNATDSPRVTDLYFENGKPVLYVEFTAQRKQYQSLKKGLTVPLTLEEKLVFADSKLKTWTEKGKAISSADSRWAEKEKDALARFNDELETYQMHLRGEL
jgi:hypothetical protein